MECVLVSAVLLIFLRSICVRKNSKLTLDFLRIEDRWWRINDFLAVFVFVESNS